MPEIRETTEFIRNLYDAEWVSILPGIRGRSGVAGIPVDMELTENLGIDMLDLEPNTAFPLHTHPGSHILFVLEGKGTVTIDDIVHETHPGDCYFIPANIPHGVGAIEQHRLLSIGFPHKALDDPQRMNIVDEQYQKQEPLFAAIYSSETDETKRRELLSTFQHKQLPPTEEETIHREAQDRELIHTKLVNYLMRFTGNEKLGFATVETQLDEYGLDSLAIFEFVLGLEDEFNITIDDRSLHIANFKTIGSTINVIYSLMQSTAQPQTP